MGERRRTCAAHCRRAVPGTGLHFPANKKNIIEYVQHKQSIKADGDEILSVLQQIQEKNYDTVADVTRSAGLVE